MLKPIYLNVDEQHLAHQSLQKVGRGDDDVATACSLQVDMPSWMTYPDFERVGWVNTVLGKPMAPDVAHFGTFCKAECHMKRMEAF